MDVVFAQYGLDLFASFDVNKYNEIAQDIPSLEKLSLKNDDIINNEEEKSQQQQENTPTTTFGYIVGHSKNFWKPFKEWYRNMMAMGEKIENPVDSYAILMAENVLKGYNKRIYSDKNGPLVALQRVAELGLLAKISNDLHLCLHPVYGPWIALRVVFLTDRPLEIQNQPIPFNKSIDEIISEEEKARIKTLFKVACDTKNWKDWLAMRDVVSFGSEHRYSEEQLEYHYTKNENILLQN